MAKIKETQEKILQVLKIAKSLAEKDFDTTNEGSLGLCMYILNSMRYTHIDYPFSDIVLAYLRSEKPTLFKHTRFYFSGKYFLTAYKRGLNFYWWPKQNISIRIKFLNQLINQLEKEIKKEN